MNQLTAIIKIYTDRTRPGDILTVSRTVYGYKARNHRTGDSFYLPDSLLCKEALEVLK